MHTNQDKLRPSSAGVLRGVTAYHWLVVLLATCGWVFSCMVQRLSLLANGPATQWLGDDAEPLGLRLVASYAATATAAGWAMGGLGFGVFCDKWGRVKTMIVTLLIYSVFTGLSGWALGRLDFLLDRFLIGLGTGGMLVVAVTLVAESVPAGARALVLGLLVALSATGNVIGNLISLAINPYVASFWGVPGWRVLLTVGFLPSLLVVPILFFLKEPVAWRQAVGEKHGGGKRGSYAELLANPRWYLPAAVAAVAALGLMWLNRGPRILPVPLLLTNDILWSLPKYFLGLILLAAGVWTLVGNRAGIRASAVLIAAALLEVGFLASAGWPKRELLVGLACLLVMAVGLAVVLRRVPSGGDVTRWRRNAIVGLGLGLAGVGGLQATGFFTRELISTALRGEARSVVDSVLVRCTALQDLGGSLGILAFALLATFVGRRWTFVGALLVCWLTTLYVFHSLRTATDAYWMLPLLGSAQFSVFGGYAIYFSELFPTRLRGTGVGFCYVMSRLPVAAVPFLHVFLINHLPIPDGTDPLRTSAIVLSCFYLLGLLPLIWAPETKGLSFTED